MTAGPAVALVLWLTGVALFELLKPAGSDATLCLLRNVTGVPCPTCGSTRAVLALADGRVLDAVLFNPLLAVATVVAILWMGVRRRVELDLTPARRRGLWTVVIALVALNWIYVIAVN